MSAKDEYIRKMHAKLDQWSNEIDALTAKADQAGAQARSEYHKHIEILHGKRDLARNKMEELQKSAAGAWEDMKAGVEMAWDAVGEALDSARSRFK